MRTHTLIRLICLLLPVGSIAQTHEVIQYFHVQSGTGFFVNRDTVITNAHVIEGCSDVIIKGAVKEHKATVLAKDSDRDLAILQTDESPQEFAPLRFNIDDLQKGDRVLIVGYPGEKGARGEYSVAQAEVQDLAPTEKVNVGRFYISDVVEHGNSGGPVFDTSGNVIGVVVAKGVLTLSDAATRAVISRQHVSIVISLATLKQFLFEHGVYTQISGSGLLYTDKYIEERAKDFIVNVQCRMPVN